MSARRPELRQASELVPAGGVFEGLVTFEGAARVAGTVQGEVRAQGCLEVSASGRILGPVRVDEVVVAGSVEGPIRAGRRLELQPGALVRGAVRSPRVQMADGSRLEGRCSAGPGEEPEAEGPAGAGRPQRAPSAPASAP